MAQNVVLFVWAVLFIWAGIVSFFLWKSLHHYNRLTKNVSEKSLTRALEQIFSGVEVAQKRIDELAKRTEELNYDRLLHVQKVGLLRFNPFKDTGGDQSFILALLDGKDNGIVISSLHSRSGTRWYAKKITSGKGVEHDLSDEEKQAIRKAHEK